MTKYPEDLSARARRDELDEDEQRRLRHLLAQSTEARLAHRAGLEFDRQDCVLPDDDALVERIAERLLAAPKPAVRRRRWPPAVLATAAVLATGVAAAGGGPIVDRVVTWATNLRSESTATLVIAGQIAVEFWVVATRPTDVNGLGWSPDIARSKLEQILTAVAVLPEPPAAFGVWCIGAGGWHLPGRR